MPASSRVLAIAVASGRVGCVLIEDGRLVHSQHSCKAAQSPQVAVEYLEDWISELRPTFIVTEDAYRASRKGEHVRAIIAVLGDHAATTKISNAAVERERRCANKYEEAALLAEKYPTLKKACPVGRRLWETEPRKMMIFEALALADSCFPVAPILGKNCLDK